MGEMKSFVNEEFGFGTWADPLDESGLEGKRYSPTETYPDSDAVAILEVASEATGLSVQELLEKFGEYIGPSLLETYSGLIDDEWNTLDLIENTESDVHTDVRKRTSGAQPPDHGDVDRLSEDELVLHYTSDRQMCGLAKGIIRAIADYNEETVAITENRCMLDGDPECELAVERAA